MPDIIAALPGAYDLFCSGGISDNIDFEVEFTARYEIQCHAFDPSIDDLPGGCPRLGAGLGSRRFGSGGIV